MITLSGFSGAGKDTILHELINLGYEPLISYTTRNKRDYEQDHIDYHYITHNEFIEKANNGFFAETTSYNTINGIAYYGSAKEDVSDEKVCIVNPDGLWQLQQDKNLNLISIFIEVDEKKLIKRLKKRGDPKREYIRRLGRDRIDFKEIEDKVDFVIDGNYKTPYELALEIIEKSR